MYVLERNGLSSKETYENVLLPVLKAKADYLHSEGVAQAVYALSSAGVYDAEIWESLKKSILSKDFDYTVVKNEQWSATYYQTHNGGEHFFQGELTPFANSLFF